MVDIVWIPACGLAAAFLMPLAERAGRPVMHLLLTLALVVMTWIPASWLAAFMRGTAETAVSFTAGFRPPFSIVLRMGPVEAGLAAAVGLIGLLGALPLSSLLRRGGSSAHSLFVLLVMGMSGMIMTRDLFNLFVFLEIVSISSWILIAAEGSPRSTAAAIKYALGGGVASVFLLIGVIFIYREGSALDIDILAARGAGVAVPAAVFLLLLALLVEAKQFPANGWALDVYEAADPGMAAVLSAGTTGALLLALWKVLPVAGGSWHHVLAVTGMATFVVSNLIGLRQRAVRRMLGYSSVAQTGLLVFVIGISGSTEYQTGPFAFIAAALFVNHFLAKAGLYWLAGAVGLERIEQWRSLAARPLHLVLLGTGVIALLGLPPFTGFWGKYELVMQLASGGAWWWLALLLLGSLVEAAYLLRWLGLAAGRGEEPAGNAEARPTATGIAAWLPPALFTVLSVAAAVLLSVWYTGQWQLFWIPAGGALLLFALGRLPDRVTGALSVTAIAGFGWMLLRGGPGSSPLSWYFGAVVLGGGALLLVASIARSGHSYGFHPLAVAMIGTLACAVFARDSLSMFASWELMTVTSYLLILRGRRSGRAALSYILFSTGGAYLLLAGIAIADAHGLQWSLFVPSLDSLGWPAAAVVLAAAGMLVKTAAIGVHVWAPGAYAEAEDDATPLLSGVLSKAGIFGLAVIFAVALPRGGDARAGEIITGAIGWIGALTAFFATLYACFQEDMKKLLAWSSVGQVGYIVLGLAAMNHLGWTAALWHTVNHLLFKGLLFLAVAGVILRTGTRLMYETGGLIKRMPLTFISVLIGIIALSGVPPLSGFAGKWLLYQSLIERGWYLQAALAFFASTIAFLYLFRLIHSVFLGQPKPRHTAVKEAPAALLVTQYLLIMGIMLISAFPGRLIRPASAVASALIPSVFDWKGLTAHTPLGYLNGTFVMLLVCAVFGSLLLFLLLKGPRPRKVGQFNIVFAAERPETPETTHYAYAFFEPYRRALAPLLRPLVRRFWDAAAEWAVTLGSALRYVYTGNAQTYLLLVFIYGIIIYIVSGGAV